MVFDSDSDTWWFKTIFQFLIYFTFNMHITTESGISKFYIVAIVVMVDDYV